MTIENQIAVAALAAIKELYGADVPAKNDTVAKDESKTLKETLHW